MKHVYYRHKETGFYISLEELKDMRERMSTLSLYKQEPIIFNEPFPINLKEQLSKPKHFKYRIEDIPFSKDFEVMCIDEQDFNLKDLDTLLAILYRAGFNNTYIYNKVKVKFDKLLRLRHEYNTPEEIRKLIE